ncbi:PREDICTED: importin subunit beta-1-like isoform X1 [Fragaria vesca subsp. vesca]|uniref:importin subunit beta-1-like isoform X1 n=1 Tax=Fragaria vesca subsp. vesca TaxID=101020 RepID=UPI0002C34669|nr:PREDICTED: importin subunit beta-1-like isoform X1 [Fragaria vesca subsp. vesca]
MAMEITQCLLSAQSADARVRNEAEYNLSQFHEQNLPAFLLSLSVELANDEKPIESRTLAGIVLKNLLDAKDPATKKHLAQKWMAIDIAFKSQIKSWLLQTLGSAVPEARHTSAQVVAKVASIDVPQKQWPELIGHLLNNMTQQDSTVGLKQSTLKTLGYVCEEISVSDLQQDEVNFVLTAVIRGMELAENSSEVRLAATRTLFNALEFAQKNFENEKDQTYIMKIICQTALSKEVNVRQAAFECLTSIASTYYSVLGTYMQALFELTSNAIKGDVEPVSLQAIEFWSSICEKEIELQKYKTVEWNHWDSSPEFAPHSRLIENSRISIVPLLLDTLLMQEENVSQDDNFWNISMAGKKCLELVSQTVGVLILPLVVPFVVANRPKPDWHCREAAVSALGAIIKGSTVSQDAGDLLKYNELAFQLIDDLVLLMNDESSEVKETTAWTLSLIFEFVHSPVGEIAGITSDNLPGVVDVLVKSLKDSPNVATKVCRAIYTLAEGYEDAEIHSSFFLPYIPRFIECLLFAASRADVDDSELRSAAYESVKEVVRCSSITQSSQIIRELLPVIMQMLSQTLELQIVSLDDKVNQADLQASLCGILQVIIEKVSSAEDLETRSIILTQADQIMFLFLNVLACRSSTVHEETMLAIGALAHATGSEFGKYLPELYKYLEMGLKNFKEYQACSVTVGVLSDIVHVLNYKVVPYCDRIMHILLINLSSEALDRSVKPPILSLIGDIALSVGECFQNYVSSAVPMMQRAAELCAQMDSNDDELLEYARQLKCSIFEAYSGILRGTKKSKIMMPYAQFLYEFIGFVLKEKDRHIVFRKALAAVMDDLADLLGTNTKTLFGDLAASVTYGGARLRSNGDNLK